MTGPVPGREDRPQGGDILVVYAVYERPMRRAIEDHLMALARHAASRCHYLNLGIRAVPRWVAGFPFDAIVFHNTFLGHWHPGHLVSMRQRAVVLDGLEAVRIALPQDEFLHSDLLTETLDSLRVDHVLSVAPESEWDKIYAGLDRSRATIGQVLTGYLPEELAGFGTTGDREVRPLDVGYRAWRAVPWLGRHGVLKTRLAAVFEELCNRRGMKADISLDDRDTLVSSDWYRFLASCRWTFGVEGGASILDRDGAVKAAVERYLAEHPDAGFDEVEAACFPGRDGELDLFALSPRHLEACATRTCQVLVEGTYNGVLESGRHYVCLDRDLGNIEEVGDAMADEALRREIAGRAFDEVVASGRWAYAHFAAEIEGLALSRGVRPKNQEQAARAHRRSMLSHRRSWALLPARTRLRRSVAGAAARRLLGRVV